MAESQFLRYFDKEGSDMNLGASASQYSLFVGGTGENYYKNGRIFFDKVSTGLIESQNVFVLQEVMGPTSSYESRKIAGQATVTSGGINVIGSGTDFFDLQMGSGNVDIEIGGVFISGTDYSVIGATAILLTSPYSGTSQTTDNVYWYDYMTLNELRTSSRTVNEVLTISWAEENKEEFYFYGVNYAEDLPYIEKHDSISFQMTDGSSDVTDPVNGRVVVTFPNTIPTQVNVAFQSSEEGIYEKRMQFTLDKYYALTCATGPSYSATQMTFYISGTQSFQDIFSYSDFEIRGYGASATDYDNYFVSYPVDVISATVSGSYTAVTFNLVSDVQNNVNANFSQFKLFWINRIKVAEFDLYAEAEAEDTRLKLTLENFGKKIDYDKEYIFRESDISEGLPDYKILNNKRKELLLEGDNIYPYLGSYKALINIINYFGYNDVRIKEYFLNVDENAPNYGKYLHLLIPRDDKQRKELKKAWEIVPSKIYKKTSLFGLFYDINRINGEEDIYGIPQVEDSFQFSIEEVLIKLFGLKELLKKEFLPLNARIYDITGEGIYFERIRIDSWADNLQHHIINLANRPVYRMYPEKTGYINDLRRIDHFYVEKFVSQGLTGFLGASAASPTLGPTGFTGPLSELYGTYIGSYPSYLQAFSSPSDSFWESFPPGVYDPLFNFRASQLFPLPDEPNIPAGSPLLLEAEFDLTWDDADFTWDQVSVFDITGNPMPITLWTWNNLGRGQSIEMRWIVEKGGIQGFRYDTGRLSIEDFEVNYTGTATPYLVPNPILNFGSGLTVTGIVGESLVATSVDISSSLTAGDYISFESNATGASVAQWYQIVSSGPTSVELATPVMAGEPGLTFSDSFVQYRKNGLQFEYTNEEYLRVLNAVALPYPGTYDVSLYLYDTSNNFSVEFKKFTVLNREVDFSSIHRAITQERTWDEFGEDISWDEVHGPWYYPVHGETTWDEYGDVSWDSVDYTPMLEQSLYKQSIDSRILEINRDSEYVVIEGDFTSDSRFAIGEYLFLTRVSGSTIFDSILIPPYSAGSELVGISGSTAYPATLTGASGQSYIETDVDATVSLTGGDSIYVSGNWYDVSLVGPTSISVTSSLQTSFAGVTATYYVEDTFTFGYSGSIDQANTYSFLLVSDSSMPYTQLNPNVNYYGYVNLLSHSLTGSQMTVKPDDTFTTRDIITRSQNGESLYMTNGLYADTFAIEITNISLTGGNTFIRLTDPNNELYKLDGNFEVNVASYDVDYAEQRIGIPSLQNKFQDEVTWNEMTDISYDMTEFHGDSLCGFTIPFAKPAGLIQIDTYPEFYLSGDPQISSSQAGLEVAAAELNASTNEGIRKFTYDVMPDDPIYISDGTGASLSLAVSAPIGSTGMTMSGSPYIPVPATISLVFSGGSLVSGTVSNGGFGYSTAEATIGYPASPTGSQATVSLTVVAGSVVSLTITDPGSGYTSTPEYSVSLPLNFRSDDNYVWTGYEWVEVVGTQGMQLLLGSPLTYAVPAGSLPLLPYQYHKQIFRQPQIFQQYYFFIHAEAKNPGSENLMYVRMDYGCEGEWVDHPFRTYSYPLRNSLLNLSNPDTNLENDHLYQKWVYEGSDYPPQEIDPVYSSPDRPDLEAKIPYMQTLQGPFTYVDTVVSSQQKTVSQGTPVMFTFDPCKIPGKTSPKWTIKDEASGETKVISTSKSLLWNFTQNGQFTVELEVSDSNGNISTGSKTSFIVVEEL